jgi:ribose transport system substrate-binding protein
VQVIVGALLAALAIGALSACGSSSGAGTSGASTATSGASTAASTGSGDSGASTDIKAKVDECLASVANKIYNKGPHGETAVAASELTLTPAEIAKVRGMNKTVAVAWHVFGSDYSTAQVAALKDTFADLGIRVLAVTDGQFQVNKQTNDIETIIARKPDYMVSLPVDAPSEQAAYQKARAAGIKLVFALNAPPAMKYPDDYVTIVGSDDYGTGVVSACQIVQALNGKGKVGLIYHAAHYYATQQRLDAVHWVFKQFPGIEVVEEKGDSGPDFTSQAAANANAMLTQHSDLDAIWAVWDTHADGVLASAREHGKNGDNFTITTIDLGKTIAEDMAQGGMVKGDGGSQPYNQGVTEAMAVAADILGKKVAPYYAWNALPVDRENLLARWKQIYHADPPATMVKAIEG